jgi:hypothetical protein
LVNDKIVGPNLPKMYVEFCPENIVYLMNTSYAAGRESVEKEYAAVVAALRAFVTAPVLERSGRPLARTTQELTERGRAAIAALPKREQGA